MQIRTVRRVVTGHDAKGRATVITDSPCPHIRTSPTRAGVAYTNLWQTDRTPAPIHGSPDPVTDAMKLDPPPDGCNFRFVEFEPESEQLRRTDAGAARAAFAAMGSAEHALTQDGDPRHPFMHRTRSVDFGIVLSGEIYLVLDDQEVLLRAGDVCIQRGTNHAWANRSEEHCLMAFVLIDGDPRPT